ncbi:MAG: SCP2 sterol-binding domain-containing protein [Marmoricola sp.]
MRKLVLALGAGDLGDPEDRDRAVRALVDHLSTSEVPWTGPAGVVRVDAELPEGGRDTWTVRFGPAGVTLVDADPQVVVRLSLAAAMELVSGSADAALLYLSGVLDVVGDESALLEIGTRLPTATGRPLIDPAALDPQAVSDAIVDTRTEHLAAVMSGGFRELVLSEVFRRLPEFVIAEKAERVRVGIGFEIGGRRDGQVDRYVVRIVDGLCTVIADAAEDEAVDATILLEGHEFLRLVLGHLNPVRGVVSGQLRVRGQVIKALGFNSVMRRPGSPQSGAGVLAP